MKNLDERGSEHHVRTDINKPYVDRKIQEVQRKLRKEVAWILEHTLDIAEPKGDVNENLFYIYIGKKQQNYFFNRKRFYYIHNIDQRFTEKVLGTT